MHPVGFLPFSHQNRYKYLYSYIYLRGEYGFIRFKDDDVVTQLVGGQ